MSKVILSASQEDALRAMEKKLKRDFPEFVPEGCDYGCEVQIGPDGKPIIVCGIVC